MTRSNAIARRVLGAASWTLLGLVVIGLLLTIPPVPVLFEAAAPGSIPYILGKCLAAIAGVVIVVAWVAGVWHVGSATDVRSDGQKAVIVILMVCGSALAAFCYYFCYLVWQPWDRSPSA